MKGFPTLIWEKKMRNLAILSIILFANCFWWACGEKSENGKDLPVAEEYHFVAPSELEFTIKDFTYRASVGEDGTAIPFGGKIGTLLCDQKQIELASNEFDNGYIVTKKFGRIKVLFSSSLTQTGMAIYLTDSQKNALLDFTAKPWYE